MFSTVARCWCSAVCVLCAHHTGRGSALTDPPMSDVAVGRPLLLPCPGCSRAPGTSATRTQAPSPCQQWPEGTEKCGKSTWAPCTRPVRAPCVLQHRAPLQQQVEQPLETCETRAAQRTHSPPACGHLCQSLEPTAPTGVLMGTQADAGRGHPCAVCASVPGPSAYPTHDVRALVKEPGPDVMKLWTRAPKVCARRVFDMFE